MEPELLQVFVIHCGLTSDTFLLNYGVLSAILYYNVIITPLLSGQLEIILPSGYIIPPSGRLDLRQPSGGKMHPKGGKM